VTALVASLNGEPLTKVVSVGLYLVITQSLVAAVYGVGFTTLFVGLSRFRTFACICLAWIFWASRLVARLADEQLASPLPGGLESYLWTGNASDFLMGCGISLTWCCLFLIGFWLLRRTAHTRVPFAA
jgi:hypothetical protein